MESDTVTKTAAGTGKGETGRSVEQAPPERALERKLRKAPHDLDAKADVGSDESMDASDPSAAAQPGRSNEPAPSSSFPEKRDQSE